jgi:hypothetical protein
MKSLGQNQIPNDTKAAIKNENHPILKASLQGIIFPSYE